MKNFITACNKKAYKHIKHIKQANNMLEVESAINSAIMHTFGTHNLGLVKIAMREGYTELLKQYKAGHYTDFSLLKAVRLNNQEAHGSAVRIYLMSFIPARFHCTEMYQRMAKAI